jgi:chromosome segregation ATPase
LFFFFGFFHLTLPSPFPSHNPLLTFCFPFSLCSPPTQSRNQDLENALSQAKNNEQRLQEQIDTITLASQSSQNELMQQLHQSANEVKEANSHSDSLERKLQQTTNQLKEMHSSGVRLEHEVAELRASLAYQSQQNDERLAQLQILHEELKSKATEFDRAEAHGIMTAQAQAVEDLQAVNIKLHDELEATKVSLQLHEAQLSTNSEQALKHQHTLEAENAQLQSRLQEQHAEHSRVLEQMRSEFRTKLSEFMESSKEESRKLLETSANTTQELNAQISGLQERLAASQQQAIALQAAHDVEKRELAKDNKNTLESVEAGWKKRYDELVSTLQERTKEFADKLSERADTGDVRLSQLQSDVAELTGKLSEAQVHVKSLERDLDRLQHEFKLQGQDLMAANADLQREHERKFEVDRELARVTQELAHATQTHNSLRELSAELKREVSEQKTLISSLSLQSDEESDRRAELHENYRLMSQQLMDLQSKFSSERASLQSIISRQADELTDEQTTHASLKVRFESMQQELERVRHENQELLATNNALESRIEELLDDWRADKNEFMLVQQQFLKQQHVWQQQQQQQQHDQQQTDQTSFSSSRRLSGASASASASTGPTLAEMATLEATLNRVQSERDAFAARLAESQQKQQDSTLHVRDLEHQIANLQRDIESSGNERREIKALQERADAERKASSELRTQVAVAQEREKQHSARLIEQQNNNSELIQQIKALQEERKTLMSDLMEERSESGRMRGSHAALVDRNEEQRRHIESFDRTYKELIAKVEESKKEVHNLVTTNKELEVRLQHAHEEIQRLVELRQAEQQAQQQAQHEQPLYGAAEDQDGNLDDSDYDEEADADIDVSLADVVAAGDDDAAEALQVELMLEPDTIASESGMLHRRSGRGGRRGQTKASARTRTRALRRVIQQYRALRETVTRQEAELRAQSMAQLKLETEYSHASQRLQDEIAKAQRLESAIETLRQSLNSAEQREHALKLQCQMLEQQAHARPSSTDGVPPSAAANAQNTAITKELESASGRVRALQAEVEQLQGRLRASTLERDTARKDAHDAQADMRSTVKRIREELDRQREAAERQRSHAAEKITELTSRVHQLQQQCDSAKRDADTARRERDHAASELASERTVVRQLQVDLERRRESSREQAHGSLAANAVAQQAVIAKLETELQSTKTNLIESQHKMKQVTQRHEDGERAHASLKRRMEEQTDRMQREMEGLRENHKRQVSELHHSMQAKIEEQTTTVANMQRRLTTAELEAQQANDTLSNMRRRLTSVEDEANESAQALAEQRTVNAHLEEQIQDEKTRVAELVRSEAELRGQVDSFVQTEKRTNARLQSLSDECAEKTQECAELRSREQATADALRKVEASSTQQAQESERAHERQVHDLTRSLEVSEAKAIQLDASVKELTAQLSDAQDARFEMQGDLARTNQLLIAAQKQREQLSREMTSLQDMAVQCRELQHRVTEYESELHRMNEAASRLTDQARTIPALKTALEETRSQLKSSDERDQQAQNDLATLKRHLAAAHAGYESQAATIEHAMHENQQWKEEYATLNAQFVEARNELKQLRTQVQQHNEQKEKEAREDDIKRLKDELQTHHEAEMQRVNTRFKEMESRHEAESSQLRTQLATAEAELELTSNAAIPPRAMPYADLEQKTADIQSSSERRVPLAIEIRQDELSVQEMVLRELNIIDRVQRQLHDGDSSGAITSSMQDRKALYELFGATDAASSSAHVDHEHQLQLTLIKLVEQLQTDVSELTGMVAKELAASKRRNGNSVKGKAKRVSASNERLRSCMDNVETVTKQVLSTRRLLRLISTNYQVETRRMATVLVATDEQLRQFWKVLHRTVHSTSLSDAQVRDQLRQWKFFDRIAQPWLDYLNGEGKRWYAADDERSNVLTQAQGEVQKLRQEKRTLLEQRKELTKQLKRFAKFYDATVEREKRRRAKRADEEKQRAAEVQQRENDDNRLTERIDSLSQDVEKLTQLNNTLTTEKSSLTNELHYYRELVARMHEKSAEQQSQHENAILSMPSTDTGKQLVAAQSKQISRLEGEKAQTQAKLRALETITERAKLEVQQLQEQMLAIENERAEALGAADQLREEKREFSKLLEDAMAEIRKLQKAERKLVDKVQAMQLDLKAVQEQKQQAEIRLSVVQTQLDRAGVSHDDALTQQEQNIASLQQHVTELQGQVESWKSSYEQSQEQVEEQARAVISTKQAGMQQLHHKTQELQAVLVRLDQVERSREQLYGGVARVHQKTRLLQESVRSGRNEIHRVLYEHNRDFAQSMQWLSLLLSNQLKSDQRVVSAPPSATATANALAKQEANRNSEDVRQLKRELRKKSHSIKALERRLRKQAMQVQALLEAGVRAQSQPVPSQHQLPQQPPAVVVVRDDNSSKKRRGKSSRFGRAGMSDFEQLRRQVYSLQSTVETQERREREHALLSELMGDVNADAPPTRGLLHDIDYDANIRRRVQEQDEDDVILVNEFDKNNGDTPQRHRDAENGFYYTREQRSRTRRGPGPGPGDDHDDLSAGHVYYQHNRPIIRSVPSIPSNIDAAAAAVKSGDRS